MGVVLSQGGFFGESGLSRDQALLRRGTLLCINQAIIYLYTFHYSAKTESIKEDSYTIQDMAFFYRRQGITTSGYYLLSKGQDYRGLLSNVKLAYCDMELPSAEESIVVQLSDLNRTVAFGAQARRAKTRQI